MSSLKEMFNMDKSGNVKLVDWMGSDRDIANILQLKGIDDIKTNQLTDDAKDIISIAAEIQAGAFRFVCASFEIKIPDDSMAILLDDFPTLTRFYLKDGKWRIAGDMILLSDICNFYCVNNIHEPFQKLEEIALDIDDYMSSLFPYSWMALYRKL